MKLVPSVGATLAGIALLAAITWAAQDAGNGKAQQPKAKQPAAAQTAAKDKPAAPAKAQNVAKDKPAAPAKPQNAAKDKPAAPAKPQEEPKGKTDADGNPIQVDVDAALAARYTKAAAVGDEHKWLSGLAGKWKTVTRQMLKPKSTAIESTGTSEFKMLMDGRFLVEANTSGGGVGNSSGMGIVGFNNVTGKYERVWFDSHSTAMIKSEGEYNKDTDEIRWVDQFSDPGKGPITTKSSLRRLNDKEMVLTQVIEGQNKAEYVALSIQYRKD
jgi:Protein of unknown function (DUF1579)